jgi:uncharacterized damage-inducible protein DinB
MSEFEVDKKQLLEDLAESRAELLATVETLQPADLGRARRGSWPIARILEHVLHSERLYTQLTSTFSGKPSSVKDADEFASGPAAVVALDASRQAFLDAVGEVREDDFYRLQTIGHEEYSVLSILENNAAHDREHAEQLRKTVAEA